MKRTIVNPEYEYVCDLCGETIPVGGYDDDLVTLSFDLLHTGVGDYITREERHVCGKCLRSGIEIGPRGKLRRIHDRH